ncbi:hypothetical protein ACFYO9_33915 [Streptomyces sp. NPDC005863]|uniref:hypothetical protein n=1 Tax=Streptomyces sp. NPDC005863 TaxID=3364735 RepID=UPI003697BEB4
MHRAGDHVTVLDGPEAGQTLPIVSVRKYATDNGYYLRGGSGLYAPRQVELATERAGGNPCGSACDEHVHGLVGDCDHCLGRCRCTT